MAEELVVAGVTVEKLAKNSLYGEVVRLRQPRKPKGTMVCCYVCGDAHTMLYKTDIGYICRTCRRKKNNMRSLSKGEGK